MKLKIRIATLFIFLAYSICSAAEVTFINLSTKPSVVKQQLELACRFYGLDLEHVQTKGGKNNNQILDFIKKGAEQVVVISASTLSFIEEEQMLSAINRRIDYKVPLLITNVTPNIASHDLKRWSDGAIIGCTDLSEFPASGFYRVADSKTFTREISGQFIPLSTEVPIKGYYLILDHNLGPEPIISIANKDKESLIPIFVKTNADGREVFFQTEIQPSDSSKESVWNSRSNRFFEIAPLLMFLRYSLGERCWHRNVDYANLTIDDPWLTEPYGYLSYKGLLKEMEKHNFHTTLAFIPWNFDRSQADVVSLFHEHPEKFSISIHGNNHDHYEFHNYETKEENPWPAKPLNVQEANIKQAIARMEKFKELTELSYDKVMVFPHGIAPTKTLGLLKKYNFLATVNAGNVPLGSKEPKDPFYRLRPLTLEFENFASIKRYKPNRSQSEIAVDLFLDNPVLFYAHHDFFKNGIDAFNSIAEMINTIEPRVQWKSLGYISRHLYLQKKREDGYYDVRSFSKNIELKNNQKRDVIYFVRKEETFIPSIKKVTVDGKLYSYQRNDSEITITISIPAGESRLIDIEYENDLDIASVDISKDDLRVTILRNLSDFRDMTLATNVLGRTLIHFYYETELYKLGLVKLTVVLLVLLTLTISGGWYIRKRFRSR